MKRVRIVLCALVVLCSLAPAHADSLERGHVRVAGAHPTFARSAMEMSRGMNGWVGWVFRLEPHADDAPYTMTVTNGMTGFEDPEVYFYELARNGRGIGEICPVSRTETRGRTETGTICPGEAVAGWGVVVLTTGADARFTIAY